MNHEQTSRGLVAARWAKRPLLLFLIAALALAMLTMAERGGGSALNGTDIARRSSSQQFRALFGSRAASPATPVAVPSVAQATTPDRAVSTAARVADTAVAQTQAVSAAAVAAQNFPPFVSAIVCPILLAARAQVVFTINALIAAFPFLAPQLNAVRASALATIDAQLAQFGCPVS